MEQQQKLNRWRERQKNRNSSRYVTILFLPIPYSTRQQRSDVKVLTARLSLLGLQFCLVYYKEVKWLNKPKLHELIPDSLIRMQGIATNKTSTVRFARSCRICAPIVYKAFTTGFLAQLVMGFNLLAPRYGRSQWL